MFVKLFVPCISIILALINLIRPMQCDGPIVIRFAKRNPKLWNLSQKKYAAQSLFLNFMFCLIVIIFKNNHYLKNEFLIVTIILLIQLMPIAFTYLILKIKCKDLK